jgi:Secretion system C-terminal sorting domain
MKKALIILITLVFAFSAKATHNRSGEILYKRVAPFGTLNAPIYTYSITVIKYTDHGALVADRCMDTVYFGDGQKGIAPRINGGTSLNCGCSGTIQCGQLIVQQNNYVVKKSIYSILHTYAGAGSYLISSSDPNRNPGIHNIPNSSSVPFYIESQLIITPGTAANSSPVFGSDPINQATLGLCFYDTLAATDVDGDSLFYELIPCAAPGYFYPETGGGTISLNLNGILTWCVPQFLSEYQVAYKVSEFRKNSLGVYLFIGYVIRDRQILVKPGSVGLNELNEANALLLYPNPVASELYLNRKDEVKGGRYTLIDMNGRRTELKAEPVSVDQWRFDLSLFERGIYVLCIEKNGHVVYQKVAKD